jgi:hypothetical protein
MKFKSMIYLQLKFKVSSNKKKKINHGRVACIIQIISIDIELKHFLFFFTMQGVCNLARRN